MVSKEKGKILDAVIILVIFIAFARVNVADNFQPIIVTHNESFYNISVHVCSSDSVCNDIHDEDFTSATSTTSRVIYINPLNSSYSSPYWYTIILDDVLYLSNDTLGYFGRGWVNDSDIISEITRDEEWNTQGEVETVWGVTLSLDSERTNGLAGQDECSEITNCVDNAYDSSSDVIGGFSGCDGIEYLGADGACHADVDTDTNTQLSEEEVEDFVGGMLGGTETLITVTYQDETGDIDFVVDNDLANYDNGNSGFITATSR